MSTIKIKSFYYSESKNFLVYVTNIREGYVYYNLVNMLEYGSQHIPIEEFTKNYERVGWLEKEDEEREELIRQEIHEEFLTKLNKEIDPKLINYSRILISKND